MFTFLMLIALGIVMLLCVFLWCLYVSAKLTLAAKESTLAALERAENEDDRLGVAQEAERSNGLRWSAWVLGRAPRGSLDRLSDHSAAVLELERELHSIHGYDLLCECAPKLPMLGVALSAVIAFILITASVSAVHAASHLLLVSGAIMGVSMWAFGLGLRLRRRIESLQTRAIAWLDTIAARSAPTGDLELRRSVQELSSAVRTMAEVGRDIQGGMAGQGELLRSLTSVLGELRVSNCTVATDARQAVAGIQEMLDLARAEIQSFRDMVGEHRANLQDVEEQRRAVANVGTQLSDLIAQVSTSVNGALGQLDAGQHAFSQALQTLAVSGKELDSTFTQCNQMFTQSSVRMQGLEATFNQMRGVIVDQFVPAVAQQLDAARELRAASSSMNQSAGTIGAEVQAVSKAANALHEGNTRLVAAVERVVESLTHTEAVLTSSANAVSRLDDSATQLAPAMQRLNATLTGAETTVSQLAEVGHRMAVGVEERLQQLDRDGLEPAIAQLRELRTLFEQLQRDLNFGGAMTDFVNTVQALWRAARAQERAARTFANVDRPEPSWFFSRWFRSGAGETNGTSTSKENDHENT